MFGGTLCFGFCPLSSTPKEVLRVRSCILSYLRFFCVDGFLVGSCGIRYYYTPASRRDAFFSFLGIVRHIEGGPLLDGSEDGQQIGADEGARI